MQQKNKEPNHVSQLVGYCLRQYRKESGWSGKEMAEQIGMSQQQLSRYERGVNAITVDMLMNILVTINIQFPDFYTRVLSLMLNHPALSSHLPCLKVANLQLDNVKQYYTSSAII